MRSKVIKTLKRLLAGVPVLILLAATLIYWKPIVFSVVNFISPPYDMDFYEKSYLHKDGSIFRLSDDGEQYPVLLDFRDDFENSATIRDLVNIERGWTQLTLMSPESPTIADFNALAAEILSGGGDFLDNRVEPSALQAHSGNRSLRALSVAPPGGMSCTKASLHTLLLHYVKGDDVWFSAWYYVEEAGDFITMMDLESTFVRGWPGMRIRLQKGYLDFELAKWEPNSVYRQPENEKIPFPLGQWVLIEAHLFLTDEENGVIQLWQDGRLIIDGRGQTLPFADAVYDSLEIGLSAYGAGSSPAILFVDDLMIYAE